MRTATFSANPAKGKRKARFTSDLRELEAGLRSGQVEVSGRRILDALDYEPRHRLEGNAA